jgi:hypothetical protein
MSSVFTLGLALHFEKYKNNLCGRYLVPGQNWNQTLEYVCFFYIKRSGMSIFCAEVILILLIFKNQTY